MTTYSTKNHSVLNSIAWQPEKPAEYINDHILMSRSTSNAYVITSDEGDVIINTGTPYQGVRTRERFEQLLGRPLKASKIIFTQSHPDHIGGWDAFADEHTETLVQQEFERTCKERNMLAPYFQPRAARVLLSMMPNPEHMAAWHTGTRDPEPLHSFENEYHFNIGKRDFTLYSMPSGETLDALIIWMPAEKTAFIGNLFGAIQGALPNFYTARGDRDRSVTRFFTDIKQLMALKPELLITGHDDPIIGADVIEAYLQKTYDSVRYIHDETVKGMNELKSMWTLMQEIQLPDHLSPAPGRSPVSWYVRAIWEEYTGWFRSELTSELYATPAQSVWGDIAALTGIDPLLTAAKQHLETQQTHKALHLIEIAITAEPNNKNVRQLQIAIIEQLIEENAGIAFDELGWLENALKEATEAFHNAQ